MISVVIRTRNEEEWIRGCLLAITNQDYHEVEIIVVDHDSQDKTLDIARQFDCRILTVGKDEFSFGRALNMGAQEAGGEFVAALSAHCIPLNDKWLKKLQAGFSDERIAAVYGRQEPLPGSDIFDKRDLWTTFGQEKRVQTKDYFFHNANSMIKRSIWEKIRFDESLSGVEDREWARRVIGQGYKIVYEPLASVYHHHGIHQGRDVERCKRVVKVIEWINGKGTTNGHE